MIFGGKLVVLYARLFLQITPKLRFFTVDSCTRTMIGSPDVVMSGKNCKAFSHKMCHGQDKENFNPNRSSPFASSLIQVELKPELLRETSPDWNLELEAKLLIVEGNIGVGKTTLTQKLADKLGYRIFLEPTTENPYLVKFYSDPHKFALKLQLWILYQRYTTYVEAVRHILNTGQGVILDRSIFSDCVFACVCTREGFISSEGYKKYQYWREKCLEHLPQPHVTIFLDAPPQCCYDRIRRRARNCESGVSLDYLEKLHEEYLQFIDSMRAQGCHVLKYDWSIFKEEKMVCDAVELANTAKWTRSKMPTEDCFIREFDISETTLK